mmetsp:Transcript_20668/g.31828  ORF Transcript_20668/g.31828 Transcript_20668/m.31828 type:complete len:479 (+) Transcript_20668:65-1501(+)
MMQQKPTKACYCCYYRRSFIVTIALSNLFFSRVHASGPWSLPDSFSPHTLSHEAGNEHMYRSSRARIVTDNLAAMEKLEEDLLLDSFMGTRNEHIDYGIGETLTDSTMELKSVSRSNIRRQQLQNQLELQISWEASVEESVASMIRSPLTQFDFSPQNQQQLMQRYDNNDSSLLPQIISEKRLRSTGTTIAGCIVEKGKYVVLAADTRATDDRMVADKRCEKVHCIASNVWCCGAGTSADLDALVRQTKYTLALRNLIKDSIGNQNYGTADDDYCNNKQFLESAEGIFVRPASVSSVCRILRDALYEGNGYIGANLVLGGYDQQSGAILTAIHPHGSMDVVPYAALGSGGLAAMGVLESRYHKDLTLDEGVALVKDAIAAGIANDLGSGSQIDMCILGPRGTNYTRAIVPEESDGSEDEIDGQIPDEIQVVDDESFGGHGVNGFGNTPYTVKSRRVLMKSLEQEQLSEEAEWDAILGL